MVDFIRIKNSDGFIKIGYARDAVKRIAAIASGMPYEIEV